MSMIPGKDVIPMAVVLLICGAMDSLGYTSHDATFRSIDDIKAEFSEKMDLGNTFIADTAMAIAADCPGEYNINQICSIYKSPTGGGWYYYSDPNDSDSFQSANLTLQKGRIHDTIGRGDCDDFAILMASLIESIGGSTRITFAYNINERSGHAYTEVYLGKKGSKHTEEIIEWLKEEYVVHRFPGINISEEEVWINLDWGMDPNKSAYPGSPYFGEESLNIKKTVVWESDQRVPPKMISIFDSMDNTAVWKILSDGNGSFININLTPGKKRDGIAVSYSLKESGWAGIYREVDPQILSEAMGVCLSLFSIDSQNNIELKLAYENNTSFNISIKGLEKDIWSELKGFYWQFEPFANNREISQLNISEIDIRDVKKIIIIISNPSHDRSSNGTIIIDEMKGLMAIPSGSNWDRATKERIQSQANELALEAELLRQSPIRTIESVQRAIESMRLNRTLTADLVLRYGLNLLAIPEARLNHNSSVADIVFSSDGKILATASFDMTARTWDSFSGKEIARVVHNEKVTCISFCPNDSIVASAAIDGSIIVWNSSSGIELANMSQDGRVNSIAFNSDGTRIISASSDGTARIWDSSSGRELARLPHQAGVNSAAFSPDGRIAASCGYDDLIKIWDAVSGAELRRMKHDAAVYALAFSPDGKKIASASFDMTARLWDVISGNEISKRKHKYGVISIAFSSDGERIASGSFDGMSFVWDAQSEEKISDFSHKGYVEAIKFSSDGKEIASASMDATARIWDAFSGEELFRLVHDNRVLDISFSPDGKRAATGSSDGSAIIWNLAVEKGVRRIFHSSQINSIAFSPDGMKIAGANEDNTAIIWEALSGNTLISLKHDKPVNYVAFSPDAGRIATASEDYSARIWDPSSGKELARLNHSGIANSIAFSADGTRVLTRSSDNCAAIWNSSSGIKLYEKKYHGPVMESGFTQDGIISIIHEDDENLQIESTNNSNITLNLGDLIFDIALSSNGCKTATCGLDYTARIWDAKTGKELQMLAHDNWVTSIGFDLGSSKLATISAFNTPRIWDIKSGQELARMQEGDYCNSIFISPDGKSLAAACGYSILIWPLGSGDLICKACSRLAFNLTPEDWWTRNCGECASPKIKSMPASKALHLKESL